MKKRRKVKGKVEVKKKEVMGCRISLKKKKRKVDLRRCGARGRETRTGESEHLVEGRK